MKIQIQLNGKKIQEETAPGTLLLDFVRKKRLRQREARL